MASHPSHMGFFPIEDFCLDGSPNPDAFCHPESEIIGKDEAGWNLYRCKLCGKEFIDQFGDCIKEDFENDKE